MFGIPPYTEDDDEGYYENPERQRNSLYASMRDCELVLRFVALRDVENIRGSMKSMLDRAMEIRLSKDQAEDLASDFRSRFKFLNRLFENDPFKIPASKDRGESLSAALYDASMVALDRLWDQRELVKEDRKDVRKRLKLAIGNEHEYELIVGRKNTAEAVRGRIDLLQSILLPG